MTYMPTSEVLLNYGMDPEIDADRREERVAEEALHLCRCIVGVAKDTGRDGLIQSIDLDTEIAGEVIDRDADLKHLVRLVCAQKVGAFTVTDAEIARVVREAVLAEVDALADRRVS